LQIVQRSPTGRFIGQFSLMIAVLQEARSTAAATRLWCLVFPRDRNRKSLNHQIVSKITAKSRCGAAAARIYATRPTIITK
jgi:hypothetical protein